MPEEKREETSIEVSIDLLNHFFELSGNCLGTEIVNRVIIKYAGYLGYRNGPLKFKPFDEKGSPIMFVGDLNFANKIESLKKSFSFDWSLLVNLDSLSSAAKKALKRGEEHFGLSAEEFLKQALLFAVAYLELQDSAVEESPGGCYKLVRLTSEGEYAKITLLYD